ncbi:MAG: efflux RND transporter periplasmic adaptor subunit [Phycisphaeraceae bacterium]|nr:efflux RND transporter periplasmic adaptor subunit [Phycisphaeraceae bacterium]MCW5763743.1 efflux RND transporter periplasmic adaptor subunit [Phycisphaeraceae bacterium]
MGKVKVQNRVTTRVAALCVGLLAVGSLGVAQPEGGPPPATVRVAEVTRDVVEQRRQVTGEVRAHRQSLLASQEPGLVEELSVDIGDAVEAGAVIARLQRTRMDLELREAQSRVASTQATVAEREALVAQAQRDLVRVREVLARESGAAPELDRAESAAAAEEARLAQARAQQQIEEARVELIEQRLDDLTIRAPFKGRVVARRTEIGQWIREGDAVVELIEVDPIDIWLDVPEGLVQFASRAETIAVHVPALGVDVEARVIATVPQGDARSRLFPVRLEVSNADGLIKPGMSATGLVPMGQRAPTLLVPKDALLKGETGTYVYYDAGGRAAMAAVERLFALGDQVAIRSGVLNEGMRVVVDGNERLFPGQPLNIVPDASR